MARSKDAAWPRRRQRSLNARAISGLGVIALVALGVGAWSLGAELAGAVVAPGRIIVEGNVKRVQPALAGPVAELFVRDGDRVEAGDLLLRIDDTQARAALNILKSQIAEAEVRRLRLLAEREGSPTVLWPSAQAHPQAADLIREEQSLFALRSRFHDAQKQRLRERIGQLEREREAIRHQANAKGREIKLIDREKSIVDTLDRKRLTTFTRPIAIERDLARFEGDQGALTAQAARVGGQISEIEMQIVAMDESRFMEAQKELRALDARLSELTERRTAAVEELERVVLRAPVGGIVHDLSVHGRGAVLRVGETVLSIVPDRTTLLAEIRIRPQDIDQVSTGQATRLRFTAFNQRTTPELNGRILRIAPELVRDRDARAPYYVAAVGIGESELARLAHLRLVPGMPAEAHILTGERTLASYLMKPLTDQFERAFREE